jgi:iron complex transport system permease protein
VSDPHAWQAAPAARAYGIAAAFLVAATLVSALVGAADLNPAGDHHRAARPDPVHPPAVRHQPAGPRGAVPDPAAAHRAGALVGGLLSDGRGGLPGRVPQSRWSTPGCSARPRAPGSARRSRSSTWAAGPGGVPIAAFAGSLAGVAVAYLTGAVGGSGTATLLLAGVAVGLFLTAVQTFVLQRSAQDLQAGLLLAARLAVRRDLAAGGGDPALLGGQRRPSCCCTAGTWTCSSVGDEEARALGCTRGAPG